MTLRRVVLAGCVAVVLLSGPVVAQNPATFKTGTEGVRLDVSVLDGATPVRGLTEHDFDVRDNNRVERFSVMQTTDAPLDVMLTIQPFGSQSTDRRALVERCVAVVVRQLRDADRLGIVWASGPPAVMRSLGGPHNGPPIESQPERAASALREGVLRALSSFDDLQRRQAVVVLTDGHDDQSWLTAASTMAAIERFSPQVIVALIDTTSAVYSHTIWNDGRRSGEELSRIESGFAVDLPRWLTDAARRSGGRTLDLRGDRFGPEVERLLSHLRTQYLITYTPSDSRPGWHTVRVALKTKKGTAITRPGYWR